jgi:putative aldouronate transport system substrate-binding protein
LQLKKRLLALVSIGVLFATATSLIGCSQKSSSNKDTSTASSSKEVEKPDKICITIDTGISSTTDVESIPTAQAEFKRITGIDLEINQPAHAQYYEKVDLAFAANQRIDVIQLPDGKITKYVAQGALKDMTDMLKNSEAYKNIDSKYVESSKLNGKLWGAPFERGNGTMTYARGDWMDKLNIKEPTNYSEFVNMLKAFKTISSDTIPLTAAGLSTATYLVEFYHDARPDFVQRNGKWVDGMSEPIMKDALQRLRDAYKDGLIDTEIVTNNTGTAREKFLAGRVGVFNYWSGKWCDSLQTKIKAAAPNGIVRPLPAIKETKYIERPSIFLSIPTTSKIPDAAFKYFIERTVDGDEGSLFFTFAEKDKKWKVENGSIVMQPNPNNLPNLYGTSMMDPALMIYQKKTSLNFPALPETVTKSAEIFNKSSYQDVLVPSSKTYSKVSADLMALRDKTLAEAVMGKVSVDDALNNYKKESQNLGIDTVIQELNK